MRNRSYDDVFRLHIHFHANQTHLHMKGFALRLVLRQRHRQGNSEMACLKKS